MSGLWILYPTGKDLYMIKVLFLLCLIKYFLFFKLRSEKVKKSKVKLTKHANYFKLVVAAAYTIYYIINLFYNPFKRIIVL